jgi:RNA-directed DNA polymerase
MTNRLDSSYSDSGEPSKLQLRGLPFCNNAAEIAIEMGISLGKLQFLTLKNPALPNTHYSHFSILKNNGETRIISAPIPSLKDAQTWILRRVLDKLEVHDAAHGFYRQRSIVTNAQPHVGKDIIVKIDLQDFFGSIDYRRVKSVFTAIGYNETVADIFSLLCTARVVRNIERDGEIIFSNNHKRCLPQGAATSPALSNIFCHSLDRDLTQIAQALKFTYTRYADDLTFSGDRIAATKVDRLVDRLHAIIDREGFKINPDKTQILGRGQQQQVTGIVVNQKLNISKRKLDTFRATLYQIERDGLAGKKWGNSPDVFAAITGYANYIAMVNPSRGKELLMSIDLIKQKYQIESPKY